MKTLLTTLILLLFSLFALNAQDTLSGNDQTKTDSPGNGRKTYGGIGAGYGNRGGILAMDFTLIFSNNWGGNISLKTNIAKSKDTPSDYFDDGNRVFSPKDYISIISINLVKEFSAAKNNLRYGVEVGPSFVSHNKAVLEINPGYDEEEHSSVWFGQYYLYNKSHTRTNTVGLSLRAKMEFLTNRSVGFDLAVFTNINNIKPVVGIESNLYFGHIRD